VKEVEGDKRVLVKVGVSAGEEVRSAMKVTRESRLWCAGMVK